MTGWSHDDHMTSCQNLIIRIELTFNEFFSHSTFVKITFSSPFTIKPFYRGCCCLSRLPRRIVGCSIKHDHGFLMKSLNIIRSLGGHLGSVEGYGRSFTCKTFFEKPYSCIAWQIMHSRYIIHEFNDSFGFIKSHFNEKLSSLAIDTGHMIVLVTISANTCIQIWFFCLKIDYELCF